jgi:TolA-binding protein
MKTFFLVACAALSLLSAAPAVAEDANEAQIAKSLEGQEMIFARRYDDAARIFAELKQAYPDSPAGWFGTMAILEMRMFEREDFHLANEFEAEAKEGDAKATAVLQRYHPGSWDLFLAGSLFGIEGFYKARKGEWWAAYTAGGKSRQIFRRVKEMDPSFVDADFGLGMYIYWRSVFAKEISFLKIFPDRRDEGRAIVQRVADQGRFAKELARANLGIMHLEDGRFAEAQKIFADYVARYPGSVILRQMLGRALLQLKRYDEAVAQFREVIRLEPAIKKAHYFIGVALVLKNDPAGFPAAEKELRSFIEMEKGGKYWPSYAHYWLGRLAEAKGDQAAAKAEYDAATELNPKVKDAARRARGMGGGV